MFLTRAINKIQTGRAQSVKGDTNRAKLFPRDPAIEMGNKADFSATTTYTI